MAEMRAFDEATLDGMRRGDIHGELHTGLGQEAIGAGMAESLRRQDAAVSTHRNHFLALAKGVDPKALMADLRSVVPLDVATVADSAACLLVIDDDYLSFGLSRELAFRVIERLGLSALRQIDRLAVPDVAIPAAITLEEAMVPGPALIAGKIRTMAMGA
jgi:pyruvate/2-oxoglutarate/acetoin dehydrogenase E1 component